MEQFSNIVYFVNIVSFVIMLSQWKQNKYQCRSNYLDQAENLTTNYKHEMYKIYSFQSIN